MPIAEKKWLPKIFLFLVAISILSSFIYLQFISNVLYDSDSYYNIALSSFIKNFGLHYKFPWAQFSVFKDAFSDKDLLLHLIGLPFLYLTNNPVLGAKLALIFCSLLFLAAYVFILKKYLPDLLAGAFLLLPFLSSVFSIYFLQLRSAALVNILTILGIWYLINKRSVPVGLIAFLYALAHVSFFMLIMFSVICEVIRYITNKDFFLKNIGSALLGSLLGIFLHPNFPYNLFFVYLNSILVPFYAITNSGLGFAGEVLAFDTRMAFIYNFALFFSLNIFLWGAFFNRRGVLSFHSSVWLAASNVYLVLSFFSSRFWYHANVLFFVFFASYVHDWIKDRGLNKTLAKVKVFILLYCLAILIFITPNLKALAGFIEYSKKRNANFENAARWMQKNIPEGKTIFHTSWDDSPFFVCLNPKNNYINISDPIFMFYRYPREFNLLEDLSLGRVGNPQEAIKKIFRAEYGYLKKQEPLYYQIFSDRQHFKIIYEDNQGAIFRIL